MSNKESETQAIHYLLVVWNDVQPELEGPYCTYEEVEAEAKIVRRADPEKHHGLFYLTKAAGKALAVHTWSNGQTDAWLEEERVTV